MVDACSQIHSVLLNPVGTHALTKSRSNLSGILFPGLAKVGDHGFHLHNWSYIFSQQLGLLLSASPSGWSIHRKLVWAPPLACAIMRPLVSILEVFYLKPLQTTKSLPGERRRTSSSTMKISSLPDFGALAVIPSAFSPWIPTAPDIAGPVMWEKLVSGLVSGRCPLSPYNPLFHLVQLL